ncbi:uncharacterized protein LOC130982695 [Arachis stenosperma]|uniref:uncharacterized protein LOC130982695 n=1 Tax=Arachis stenosperma TaxID=217475 RepID=UPI0025AD2DE7|nr:uncharacterized protein LOC130982695 [Arachis stenosperma]XP_057762739.1 uncharacterized protein LOC130982695 [Arachis stenosperma]
MAATRAMEVRYHIKDNSNERIWFFLQDLLDNLLNSEELAEKDCDLCGEYTEFMHKVLTWIQEKNVILIDTCRSSADQELIYHGTDLYLRVYRWSMGCCMHKAEFEPQHLLKWTMNQSTIVAWSINPRGIDLHALEVLLGTTRCTCRFNCGHSNSAQSGNITDV